MARVDFRLYFITDRHLCGERALARVVDEACAAGVKAVQLREKDLAAAHLFETGAELLRVTRKHQARLLINERVDVALAVGADGVQLTSRSLPVEAARALLPPDRLIGVSTHSVEEAKQAEKAGADFLLFGPVFDTPSKRAYGPPQGLEKLRRVADSVTRPVFAVGGVTPERTASCLAHGAWGVAVISAIAGAERVAQAVAAFRHALGDTL